jgi:hypothetical protein
MDVRENVGDSPSPNSGKFAAPCGGIEMIEDDPVHPLVDGVTLHEHLTKVANTNL